MKRLIALFVLISVAICGYSQKDAKKVKTYQQKAIGDNVKLEYGEQEATSELEKLKKLASFLPKDKQRIFYLQYNNLKNQIEQAENEVFKWTTREDLAKEMNNDGDGAKYAAAIHGVYAAVKKENAEEKLDDVRNRKALLEDALRIAYERTVSIQSQQKEKSQGNSTVSMTDKNNHSEQDVLNYECMIDVNNRKQGGKITEGGHLLCGQTSVCFIIDSNAKSNHCKIYSIKNVKYILLNETSIFRMNESIVKKMTELTTGEYSFSDIFVDDKNTRKNRSREEAIPSNIRTQRGL